MNYLNVDQGNSLYFDCSKQSDRWVNVQQEYTKEVIDDTVENKDDGSKLKKHALDDDEEKNETLFDTIYKIKIWEITLRELLVFQSIYLCQTTSAIVDIVND